jgi:hypothetical protein
MSRRCNPAIPPHRLVCAFEEPYVARFKFGKPISPLGFRMQKHAAKIRLCENDHSVSDGYYVFLCLICAVAVMICTILLAFGIEMLL